MYDGTDRVNVRAGSLQLFRFCPTSLARLRAWLKTIGHPSDMRWGLNSALISGRVAGLCAECTDWRQENSPGMYGSTL